MYSSFKISKHEHFGRLRPHEHTSYLPLAFMVLLVGVVLGGFTIMSVQQAFADHPDPQAGSVSLTGTVPATPPKIAAVITSPRPGQHFNTSPVTISGTCPPSTLVEIYKNNIFAGSTPCGDNGKFSIDIDPLYGQNVITAQVYDNLNQGGPQSESMTIYYDAALPQGASIDNLNFNGTQLLLNSNAVYRGTFPGQTLNVPVTIIGGSAPYAVNVLWGDANNKVIPRSDNSLFNASHSYQKAGTYQITLQGTDSHQQVAFLTVAAIVNGQPAGVANTGGSGGGKKSLLNKLLVLWPLYAITATMVISFWLGERREKKIVDETIHRTPPPLGIAQH